MISFGFSARNSQTDSKLLFDACLLYVERINEHDSANLNSGRQFSEQVEYAMADTSSNLKKPTQKDGKAADEKEYSRADSVRLDSLRRDSTARLKYFKYQRKDQPNVPFRPKKQSKFFAAPKVTRSIELDSTGKFVLIKETVAGQQTKIRLKMPVEEFIKMRYGARNRDLWEELGYKYELKSTEKDLNKLITDITNIDIPLPSAGILSIFGPPKINLRIGGAVNIHGAWRNETTEGLTASRMGNTRNEPDFKQDVQINVNGTIGDKLKISADWNTERTFEYENQLKIKYTGYEDEIIQSVEAGNVSLQTSPLVGGSEALFGVKAEFKLGPLTLTTIASQKKGEVEEVSITGGSNVTKFEKHLYDYSPNHYFVDGIYADTSAQYNLFYKYYGNPIAEIEESLMITDIQVWRTVSATQKQPNERNAVAFIDLDGRLAAEKNKYDQRRKITEDKGGEIESGRFVKLTEGSDYILHPETGYITFKTQVQDNDIIAVAYRIKGNSASDPSDDFFYGEFDTEMPNDSAKMVLKLIKPKNLTPQYTAAWKLQLKNIYAIGGRDVNKEKFLMDILYTIPGEEPKPEYEGIKLLNAMGLDRTDESGNNPTPDGKFDFISGRTIIPETGEIIFPKLQPFGRSLPKMLPDTLAYQSVYDKLYVEAKKDNAKDKFILRGEYSASSTSVFSLGFMGVVENSVRVTLGGRELKEGVDYVVDYNMGQVTIRNEAALAPGADLKISYEKNDIFQMASKTLLGARGMWDISKKTKLGFSILSLNQQTLSDKVRIGEEPLNNAIYGIDFSTNADMPFLTKALDNIYSTKEMSNVSFKGEFAYISPDPNTKKSSIRSDQGESIAYIDDFEGSKRTIPLGVGYTSWKDLSVPDSISSFSQKSGAKQMLNYKAKAFWYNIPNSIHVQDIWPNRQTARKDDQITALDFVYLPDRKGTFNYRSTPFNGDSLQYNWGGMMKLLGSTATNLVEDNIEFIEFWMRPYEMPEGAKLYIDLGKVSEDVNANGIKDTEDKNGNDLIDNTDEDTGIDGLPDSKEPGYSAANSDPTGDNFRLALQPKNYMEMIDANGTQGNQSGNSASIDIGNYADTEDLNRNGQLDKVNSYFRYEIPLDTTRSKNPYVTGGGLTNKDGDKSNWYQFRIPLKEFKMKVGDPNQSVVEYVRVWVKGLDKPVHMQLVDFNLVGNQWQKVKAEDEVLTLSTINYEENSDYQMPPGINRERDRMNTEENILKNEQSLSMLIKDLRDNDKREIVKFLYKPLDVFNYKQMKLFVHGEKADSSMGSLSYYRDEKNYASDVYFRFGTDSTNYYEYRQPLRADWQEIAIKFSELTALKQVRGDSIKMAYLQDVPGKKGHKYGVRGNPALTKVSYFTTGVANPKDNGVSSAVSGSVWVNELRVIGADDSKGWAYSASTTIKLADLMTVNLNMSQQDPYFHRLSDRFGSRNDSKNWGVSVDLDVMKLMPVNMPGSNLRVSYQRTEQVSKPLYMPGTDVAVSKAAEQVANDTVRYKTKAEAEKAAEKLKAEVQTINITDIWTLSNIKLKIPSEYWLIRDTFNSLAFSFSFTKMFGRDPQTLINKSWNWNATANYAVNLSPDYYFYPSNIPGIGSLLQLFTDYRNARVFFTPQSLTWNITAQRKYGFTQARATNVKPNVSRDFSATRSLGFNWKFTEDAIINPALTYSLDIGSSLSHLLTRTVNNELIDRREGEVWGDIFRGNFFGKDNRLSQSIDLRTSPRLPGIWGIQNYFNISATYTVQYMWQNNFTQEQVGRSAGYTNRIGTNMTLRLKALFEPLFKEDASSKTQQPQEQGASGRNRNANRDIDNEMPEPLKVAKQENAVQDSVKTASKADSLASVPSGPGMAYKGWTYIRSFLKYVLFDYENIGISFNQDNSMQGNGIGGSGTGIYNFWGIRQNSMKGPSRLFMLGLSNDLGPRAPKGNLSDVYSQRNNLELKTSRPLWEGATLSINWKVGWSINKNTSLKTDSLGNMQITSVSSTGSIDRSFVSIPPILIFKSLSGLKRVKELYNPQSGNVTQAFLDGFETLPVLSKVPVLKEFARFIPRANWQISWDGLEKYGVFSNWAKRVSLSHAYTGGYAESWKITPDGRQETQSQKVNYGFAPLVGLNITFNELWKGNLSGNAKYSTKTSYDLGSSTKNITENFSREIGLTLSYSKTGFDIPLFGISLKNDVEFSFTYNNSKNSVVLYDLNNWKESGTPQDGTVRTSMEPKLRITMSSRVNLSVFYKRSSVQPEGASRVPPTTTNEMGLDVHISIQPGN